MKNPFQVPGLLYVSNIFHGVITVGPAIFQVRVESEIPVLFYIVRLSPFVRKKFHMGIQVLLESIFNLSFMLSSFTLQLIN